MNRSSQYGEAGPARRRSAFLWHLATFTWVMLVLLVIDLLTGTDELFVHWVAAIWGTILGVHLVDAFLLGGFLGFSSWCHPPGHRADRSADA